MSIDVLANARSLGPSLSDRAEAIETQRRLPKDVVSDLQDAGLFRLFVPTICFCWPHYRHFHATTRLLLFEHV